MYAVRLATLVYLLGLLLDKDLRAFNSPVRANEVWVGSTGGNISASGTLSDPYDGSTSQKFDAVLAAIPPNTTIHVLPGIFLTRGIVPKSGWRLYLSEKTTLRLDALEWIPGQKWAIFGGGSSASVSNIRIEGGVWDCNLQNQKIPLAAEAISFISDAGNVTIKNIKVVNWGSTLLQAECFVVGVFNVGSTGMIARNVTFDGIEVSQPAPIAHRGTSTLIGAHGEDPVNAKALSNGWIRNVEIKNCYVHDIDLPLSVAAIGMGSWCQGVRIHHNRFQNLGPKSNTLFGCYLDTGASNDVLVEKNLFAGVVHGIWATLSAPDPVGNWVIRHNRILINRNYSSGGIELNGSNTKIRNVVIEGNTIASSTGIGLTTYGIALGKVNGAIVRQNTIDDVNGSNQIVFGAGAVNCQESGNHRRNGVSVRAQPSRPQ